MKKYWKIITLVVVIVAVFGTFYINNLNVSKNFPQFTFKKIEGNEDAVESLVVNGDLFWGIFGESFQVDKNGTKYLRDESFLKRMGMSYPSIDIEKLQKDHRQFMRGKEHDLDYYFENDDVLVYGATPYDIWSYENYHFEIAVLDKQTNKTTSFTVPIPNRSEYWYVEPYGVVYEDKTVSIITMNEKMTDDMNETESTDVHLYTFDVEKEALIKEEVIGNLSSEATETGYESVDILFEKNSNQIIVIQSHITNMEIKEDSDYYSEEIKVNKILSYNLVNGEVSEIKPPESETIGVPLTYNENNLYFARVDKGNLRLVEYDMNKEKEIAELEVPINNPYLHIGDIYQALVKNNTLYFVPSSIAPGEDTSIIVIDLDAFTLDYYGKVENTNPVKMDEELETYFAGPELREE